MTKDNWIKALREWIKTQHGSAGWEQKLENFISQVEKDAIEKTNKRWEHRIKTRIGQTKSWLNKQNENSVRLYYLNMIEALSDLLEDKHEV